jgi:hypothetical protein
MVTRDFVDTRLVHDDVEVAQRTLVDARLSAEVRRVSSSITSTPGP